jgi:hypothetical protein
MFALVGIVYLAKAAILHRRPSVTADVLWFAPFLALAVPVTWALDPDWNNPHWYPVASWVGTPVILLTVPAVSFALDLWTLTRLGRIRSAWWIPLELLIVLPAWTVFWVFFSFYVLEWGWI